MEMNGYIIRSYMVKAGVTVLQIASQLGMRSPTISQVIHGVRKNPRIREAIAAAINRPVSELWPEAQADQSESANKNTPSPDTYPGVPVGADASIVSGDGVVSQGNLSDQS